MFTRIFNFCAIQLNIGLKVLNIQFCILYFRTREFYNTESEIEY